MTAGKTVFHPFGGLASFGMRGDIDPETHPDVRADAWLPPFRRDAFDVVVLDPPYFSINQQMKSQLFFAASFIARKHVIWFHTMWVANGSGLKLERSWLVRVGDSCRVRCIQEFAVKPGPKPVPVMYFTRGPAMKYNKWLSGQLPLLPKP